MKLSGLQTYLSKSLGHDVERIDTYRGLVGSQVTGAPAFQENALSFAVSYGLALQGLGKAGLKTNLLPREIDHRSFERRRQVGESDRTGISCCL